MVIKTMKKSFGEIIFDALNVCVLTCLAFATLYPFIYVLFASVSQPTRLNMHTGLLLWPLGFMVDSYKTVFRNPFIITGYFNTLFVVFVGTALSLLLTMLGAYVLSRKNVYWSKLIVILVMVPMFVRGGLIPFYLVVRGIGLYDTRFAMIIPSVLSTYNMIIMRTYFAGIPDAMSESAKIDGANHFTILFKIIAPMSMPIIAVMILLYGVGYWNSWFSASIFISRRDMYPMQLILREILIQNDMSAMTRGAGMSDRDQIARTVKYATIVVTTVPVLMIYPFLQKYFVKGIMIGALKE